MCRAGLQNKAISLIIPKGPVDLRQPRVKQDAKDQPQPPSPFVATPKASEETKTAADPSPLPCTSNSSVAELDPKIKDALAKKLAKGGRGRGSKKTEEVNPPRRNRRQFRCSYCDYASVRRYNTERHIRLRHPSYRYRCPLEQCGQILLDESELRVHLQGHSSAAFLLQCQGCGVVCGDYDSLLNHQNTCPAAAQSASGASGATPHQVGGEGGGGEGHSGGDTERVVVGGDASVTVAEDANEQEQGEPSCVYAEDVGSDNEDSIEIVDDDNLPVHFMVKEEEEEEEEGEDGVEEEEEEMAQSPEVSS
ncbi:hypothetical protein ACOMHN_059006 [Nucella lapillus]